MKDVAKNAISGLVVAAIVSGLGYVFVVQENRRAVANLTKQMYVTRVVVAQVHPEEAHRLLVAIENLPLTEESAATLALFSEAEPEITTALISRLERDPQFRVSFSHMLQETRTDVSREDWTAALKFELMTKLAGGGQESVEDRG